MRKKINIRPSWGRNKRKPGNLARESDWGATKSYEVIYVRYRSYMSNMGRYWIRWVHICPIFTATKSYQATTKSYEDISIPYRLLLSHIMPHLSDVIRDHIRSHMRPYMNIIGRHWVICACTKSYKVIYIRNGPQLSLIRSNMSNEQLLNHTWPYLYDISRY